MATSGKISFGAAVLMSLNIMVGAGIFFGPQLMAKQAGSWAFLGWIVVAVAVFPIMYNIAQAAKLFPGDGGFYDYASAGLGEAAGFLAVWSFSLAYLAVVAIQALVIKDALVEQIGLGFAQSYPVTFYALFFVLLALLNFLSVTLISKVQSIATIIKMLPLFFVVSLLAWYFNPGIIYSWHNLLDLGATVPVAIFAYNGWESCVSIGHMIEGGQSRVPKVMMTAFFTTAILYTLFHFSVNHIMGTANLVNYGAVEFPRFLGLSAGGQFFIQTAIAYAFLLSYFNGLYGASLANVANIQGLARKKLLMGADFLMKENKAKRPVGMIILHSIIVFLLVVLIGIKESLIALTGLGLGFAFLLTLLSLLVIYKKRNNVFGMLCVGVGFLSWGLLNYYNWVMISDDMTMRFIYSSPLTIGLILGYLMYRVKSGQLKKA